MNYENMFVPIESDEDLYIDSDKNLLNSNDAKLLNKHFHRTMKKVNTKVGKKRVVIEYYSSGPMNTTITHAVSGAKQIGFQVGSIYEDLFFKVSLTTSSTPLTLFYYSPEEYERMTGSIVSQHSKERFRMNQWVIRNDPLDTNHVSKLFYENPAEYRRVTGIV